MATSGPGDVANLGSQFLNNSQGAMKQGVELATMAEKVQGERTALEKQKQDLEQAKFDNTFKLLNTVARSNPKIGKAMIPRIQERFNQMGVAIDPLILDELASDQVRKNDFMQIAQILSKPDVSQAEIAEAIGALGKYEDYSQAVDGVLKGIREQRLAQQQLANQKKALDNEAKRNAKEDRKYQQALEKEQRGEAGDLATKLGKDSMPEIVAALNETDTLLRQANNGKGIFSDEKLKGLAGLTGAKAIKIFGINVGETGLTKEEKEIKQAFSKVKNAYLKLRSGGAVTDPEAERFFEEIGTGVLRDPDQIKTGLQQAVKAVKTGIKNFEAGVSPEAVALYKQRGGTVSSDALPSGGEGGFTPQEQAAFQLMTSNGFKPEDAKAFIMSKRGASASKQGSK